MKHNGNLWYRKSKTFGGLYNSWRSMKSRCYCKNHNRYKYYGAKGIIVCDDWLEFKNFLEWSVKNGWRIGLTIDRINPKLDYSPENCQWLSRSENSKKEWRDKIICVR